MEEKDRWGSLWKIDSKYLDLKKKGGPIPANDIWIAASAMRHGLSLFTYDDHFNNVDGLILHK